MSPVETTSSGRQRCGSRTAAKRATTARCLEARAAADRHGPGRVYAPLLTRTEDGQGRGRGGGVREEVHGRVPEAPTPSRSPAQSTTASTTTTACQSSGARGLTVSPASGRWSESRGASWSRLSTRTRLPASSRSCAADGGLSGESVEDPRQVGA